MNAGPIPLLSLLRYGFIALPVAFAGFPLYVLAPDYYAVHYQIPLGLLGFILLGLRLTDAVVDPVLGLLIDRLQNKLLWPVLGASVLLCVTIFALFNIKAFSPAIWFALCMGVAIITHSMMAITLGVCATLWTHDKDEQTKIAAIRESFGLIGLICAVSMPSLLGHFVNPSEIYIIYSLILSGLMIVAFSAFIKILPAQTPHNAQEKSHFPSLFTIWQGVPQRTRKFYLVYGLSMFASSIPAVLVVFFVRDLLGAEHLTGVFLATYFFAGAAATPLWTNASLKFGKYPIWCFSTLVAVVSFIGAFFLRPGDVQFYLVICLLSGLALGADLTLAPSILSDQIHTNEHSALSGTYYALLSFTAKAGLALASAISLSFLDFAGFKPNAVNDAASLLSLSTAYALIPCALKLMAAGILYVFFIRPQSGGHHVTR
mgnify:FL=1